MLHGNGPDLDAWYVVADLAPLPPAVLESFADACGGQALIVGTRAVGAHFRLRP